MNSRNSQILVVDDDIDVVSALRYLLETEGYKVTTANSPVDALSALRQGQHAAILMDLNYSKDTTSGQEGLDLIAKISEFDPLLPIIAMTAWGSIETAVSAMQAGAGDFIQKPWENARLLSVLSNQLQLSSAQRTSAKLQQENQILRQELGNEEHQHISKSPKMLELMESLRQVASSDANLLLVGENGTGKSFLVNQIHLHSQRKDGPLIKLNMGSITETLFESEMFGHVKGAFTDARETRMGRFELAESGTLFLDEIGNTPYSQQSKLLRVLEDRRFEKVGASKTQLADVRLVCATNCDLEAAIAKDEFRKDLYYRVNTITIEIPPLRERVEDIPSLAKFFLATHTQKYNKKNLYFAPAVIAALLSYNWPGNVRELSNVIERATLLAQDEITVGHLGLASDPLSPEDTSSSEKHLTLEQVERKTILHRLKLYDGKNQQVADTLGLSKSAFYRHLKKHGLT